MREGCAPWVLLAAAACAPEPHHYVPFPPSAGARAIILAIDGEEITAMDLGPGVPPLLFDRSERSRRGVLEVLVYDQSLEALLLSPGLVPRAPSSEWGSALPATPEIYTLDLDQDGAEWVRAERPSAGLDAFRTLSSRCGTFRVEVEAFPFADGISFSAPTGGGTVVTGKSEGGLWLIGSSTLTPLQLPAGRSASLWAGTLDEDGTLYLGDSNGVIARAEIRERSVALTDVATTAQVPRYMDGGLSDLDAELYVLTRTPVSGESQFGRLAGGEWHVLHEFAGQATADAYGGVVRLGPQSAIAGRATSSELVRIDRGIKSIEHVGSGSEVITALAFISGVGELAGTSEGHIYRRRAQAWEPVPATGTPRPITVIAPFGDGFWYGAQLGAIGHYTSARGMCLAPVIAPNTPLLITPIGERWLFTGGRIASISQPRIGWVSWEP